MIRTFLSSLLIALTLLGSACSQLQTLSTLEKSVESPGLSLEQISESGQPGEYSLYGTADLPDGVGLTVSAIRSLSNPPADSATSPIYAILDRTLAEVNNGRWQSTLFLGQVSPDGSYQEDWQRQNTLSPDQLSPSSTVTFLVTVEPETLAEDLSDALATALKDKSNPILNFTPDGKPYLKVSQSLAVPLPSDSQITAAKSSEILQSSWENRTSTAVSGSALESTPETPFMEDDNLPLPDSNMMR